MRRGLAVGALLISAGMGGCVVPNVVLPVVSSARKAADLDLPPRAEWVEVPLPSGEVLRGFWSPSDAGAPVVVQFMEATVGASQDGVLHRIAWELPDAGCALLALDYRGVAASGGARSTEQVRADARAMWDEAVHRAGGDPARVALRGGSLGALAAATLLQDGASPGAIVLYGPVRSQSVVKHFLTTGWAGVPRMPAWAAPWLAAFVRQPLAVDLAREIAAAPAPVLLTCASSDELLPMREVEELRRAWQQAPQGSGFVLEEGTHDAICRRHHALGAIERDFLQRHLPVRAEAAARAAAWRAALAPELLRQLDAEPSHATTFDSLAARRFSDPPRVAALLLLAGHAEPAAEALLAAERLRRGRWLTPLSDARLREAVELADPGGSLTLEALLTASLALAESWPRRIGMLQIEPVADGAQAWIRVLTSESAIAAFLTPRGSEVLAVAGGANDAERHRRAQRLLLKAAGLPAPDAPDLAPLSGNAAERAAAWREMWAAVAPAPADQ